MGPREFAGDTLSTISFIFSLETTPVKFFSRTLVALHDAKFSPPTSHHHTPSPHQRRFHVSGSMDRGATAINGIGNECVNSSSKHSFASSNDLAQAKVMHV